MSTKSEQYLAWSQTSTSEASGLSRDWLRRALAGLTQARQQSVNHRIALYLEGLSDVRPVDLGFSAAEIETIRAGRSVAEVLARRARRPDQATRMPEGA
jgi:hypothetical protein